MLIYGNKDQPNMKISIPVLGRLLFCGVVTLGAASAAVIPQSSCTFNNVGGMGFNGGFRCNLYPSDAAGNLNDINLGIQYPVGFNPSVDPITPGYLVIVDPGLDPTSISVQSNPANYLQVVAFVPIPGMAPTFSSTSINLYSRGCNNIANPNDTSCFPTYAQILSTSHFFDVEPSASPAYSIPYDYSIGDLKMHDYKVYYVAEAPVSAVPEPSSFAFLASGVVGLVAFRKQYLGGIKSGRKSKRLSAS